MRSSDYVSSQYAPTCTVAGARCDTVTAFYPSFQLAGVTRLVMLPNRNRTFNGVEVSGRRRMANHWMMNGSVNYNAAIDHYGDGDFQNPNNIDKLNGFQYAPQSAGSGIGNVFLNSK